VSSPRRAATATILLVIAAGAGYGLGELTEGSPPAPRVTDGVPLPGRSRAPLLPVERSDAGAVDEYRLGGTGVDSPRH
jgi:hypothetical protein